MAAARQYSAGREHDPLVETISDAHCDAARKSFKNNKPPSVELGTGSIDYTPIFAAAAATKHIRHAFVEQEEFQGPIMDALKVDAEYMKKFHA